MFTCERFNCKQMEVFCQRIVKKIECTIIDYSSKMIIILTNWGRDMHDVKRVKNRTECID